MTDVEMTLEEVCCQTLKHGTLALGPERGGGGTITGGWKGGGLLYAAVRHWANVLPVISW